MNQTLLTTWRVTDTRWISSVGERPLGAGKCRPAAEIENGIAITPGCDVKLTTAARPHKYGDFLFQQDSLQLKEIKHILIFCSTINTRTCLPKLRKVSRCILLIRTSAVQKFYSDSFFFLFSKMNNLWIIAGTEFCNMPHLLQP